MYACKLLGHSSTHAPTTHTLSSSVHPSPATCCRHSSGTHHPVAAIIRAHARTLVALQSPGLRRCARERMLARSGTRRAQAHSVALALTLKKQTNQHVGMRTQNAHTFTTSAIHVRSGALNQIRQTPSRSLALLRLLCLLLLQDVYMYCNIAILQYSVLQYDY